MGVGLRKQRFRLGLECLHGVGAGSKAGRGFLEPGERHECVGDVRATYARRPDGRIDVVNRCRTAGGETEARGVARIVDEQAFARLKVRFAPAWLSFLPVWGDYWIIGLADDYTWAVVGSPDRKYLWILARTPRLDAAAFERAVAAARVNGFDSGLLIVAR